MMVNSEIVLDNPIWNALSTRQRHFAVGEVGARRFDPAIGPLAGISEPGEAAYADLVQLLPAGEVAILFLQRKPQFPPDLKMLREGLLTQMICRVAPKLPSLLRRPNSHFTIDSLTLGDVPEMIELVNLTEPGPFGKRTIELGGYLGIRENGRLAAMAGQRLAPEGFTEVSAVCTHPDFRGRGYGQLLVATVAKRIRERGETPFLTLVASNAQANRVYESVGFVPRRTLELAIVTPASPVY